MVYYAPGEGTSRCVGERAGPGVNLGGRREAEGNWDQEGKEGHTMRGKLKLRGPNPPSFSPPDK